MTADGLLRENTANRGKREEHLRQKRNNRRWSHERRPQSHKYPFKSKVSCHLISSSARLGGQRQLASCRIFAKRSRTTNKIVHFTVARICATTSPSVKTGTAPELDPMFDMSDYLRAPRIDEHLLRDDAKPVELRVEGTVAASTSQ